MSKANIVSWIALALSIIACIITWVRIDVYFTNDTFVGIMAGFMGACATIVVGAQIYNSIETSRKIKELEKLQSQINSDIIYLKEEREKGNHYTTFSMNLSVGVSTMGDNIFFSYHTLAIALKEALILNKPEHIEIVISNIETLCKSMNNRKDHIAKVFKPEKYKPELFKIYPAFPLIADRYQKSYNIAIKVYRQCQKQSKNASEIETP